MTWHYFPISAVLSALLRVGGAWASWKSKSRRVYTLMGLGLAVFSMYILWMWITLDRPPLRTMGETRLWYSLFLPLVDLIVYSRWRYKWILPLSILLSPVSICVNILKPEIHSKTLMPALQSPWSAPHVIVYTFTYALPGAAFVMSAYLLIIKWQKTNLDEMDIYDSLTYAGWAFLTTGMLFGTLWTKEAWGHYWAWGPRETWATTTWLACLVYIHLRLGGKGSLKAVLWMLVIDLALLQTYWWDINFLSSTQGVSIHTHNID